MAQNFDVASWDVQPMGGLTNAQRSDADKTRYLLVCDPGQTASNYAPYRAVGRGRVRVMAQQPGPVNSAAPNPSPADGMVRLCTWR